MPKAGLISNQSTVPSLDLGGILPTAGARRKWLTGHQVDDETGPIEPDTLNADKGICWQ